MPNMVCCMIDVLDKSLFGVISGIRQICRGQKGL